LKTVGADVTAAATSSLIPKLFVVSAIIAIYEIGITYQLFNSDDQASSFIAPLIF